MNKETYERLMMDVTKFDVEDVITTSGVGPGPGPGGMTFDVTETAACRFVGLPRLLWEPRNDR